VIVGVDRCFTSFMIAPCRTFAAKTPPAPVRVPFHVQNPKENAHCMNDEELLIEEIINAPQESAPLSIYADWLEERQDPRAEFLRLVLEFRFAGNRDEAVGRRLQELATAFKRSWIRKVTPGLNDHKPLRKLLGQRYHRTSWRAALEAEATLFLSKYGRKSQPGGDPNDRTYDREVEKRVKRMKPEELDELLRGDLVREDEGDCRRCP
jgi:uncharacterized protein (TIGR02996 family)